MVGSDRPNLIGNTEDPVYPSLRKDEDVTMKGDPANFTTIVPTRKVDHDRGGNLMLPAGRRSKSKEKKPQ